MCFYSSCSKIDSNWTTKLRQDWLYSRCFPDGGDLEYNVNLF